MKTLESWDIRINDAFFLGGIEKARVLRVLPPPHIFFDDQLGQLASAADEVPSAQVPFGIVNLAAEEPNSRTAATG